MYGDHVLMRAMARGRAGPTVAGHTEISATLDGACRHSPLGRVSGTRGKLAGRRWKIERTFSWLGSYRRLLVRHEYYSFVFAAFIKLACLLILLKRF